MSSSDQEETVPPVPEWLPPVLPFSNDWGSWIAELYSVFSHDFKQSPTYYDGKKVIFDRKILPNEKYEEGFWHLVSRKDQETGQRLADFFRGERLPWCAPTLRNAGDVSVKVWDYKERNNRVRTYVWLENLDYLVILEKKTLKLPHLAFLVTAYYIDGESTRRSLRKKFESRTG